MKLILITISSYLAAVAKRGDSPYFLAPRLSLGIFNPGSIKEDLEMQLYASLEELLLKSYGKAVEVGVGLTFTTESPLLLPI